MSGFKNFLQSPVMQGLVGWWRFREGNGIITNDSSIYNNKGILTNSPTWINGPYSGYALKLVSSSTQYVNMGVNLTSIDVHDKSICAWINPTTLAQFGIVDKDFDGGSSNYGGWGMWLQSNGKLWWWALGGSFDQQDTNLAVSVGIWSHVCCTWSTNTKIVNFYVNGVFSSSITGNSGQTEKASGSSTNFTIGAFRNNTNPFNGSIGEVRIYNRILAQSEIQLLASLKNY